jgi:hypothetical protein
MIGRWTLFPVAWLAMAGAAAASGPSESTAGQARYLPIQSISYEFGSKFMSGYFVQEAATCVVTLMIAEKTHSEVVPAASAARVRLTLSAGQIVGLDSEEGRSLNLTCGEGATAMLVDAGETERLLTFRDSATQEAIAQRREEELGQIAVTAPAR